MSFIQRRIVIFSTFFFAIVLIGLLQSWNVALGIFNLCLISATMALGVNIQLGYAGIFNAGVMGFAALGGLAALASSSSSVEWHGTFRHQPCGFRVSACRRLYSRLGPSPLCASPRILSALCSPSGFGSRSLVLPPALP